jgi:hypothetical protein
MAVSILVRLVSSALSTRRVAGEVEVVSTGERQIFRDADELLAILTAQSDVALLEHQIEIAQPAAGASDA